MLGAEIREHVVIEGHAAAQPLVGAVALTEAFDLAGTGDAIDGRPEQQGKEDAKVRGIAAHMALDGLDGLEEFGQIDGFDEGPDEAGEMIGIEAWSSDSARNSPWKRSGRLMRGAGLGSSWAGAGGDGVVGTAGMSASANRRGWATVGAAVGDGCPSRAVAGWETGSAGESIIVHRPEC